MVQGSSSKFKAFIEYLDKLKYEINRALYSQACRLLAMAIRTVFKLNRYRRELETCPQAKTSKSGHAIFLSFSATRPSDEYDSQRRVENTRVHFWTFSPVWVNGLNLTCASENFHFSCYICDYFETTLYVKSRNFQ